MIPRLLLCLLSCLPLGVCIPTARAELPPSAYEKMQSEAPEVFRIKVLQVSVDEKATENARDVTVLAQVLKVGRSTEKVQPEELITIKYRLENRPPGFVGPGPVPILEQDAETIAYLKSTGTHLEFTPAAGAMSFSRFL